METPLERQIRAGLRHGADNIRTSHDLYRNVRERIVASRRRRRLFTVAATAAALVAIALVVPPLTERAAHLDISDVAGAPAEPNAADTPGGGSADERGLLVGIGPDKVVLVDPAREMPVEELFAFTAPAEGRVAVRPGSTRRDLTAAFTRTSEAEISVWTVEVVDGEPRPAQRAGYYPASADPSAQPALVPTPVWSPDGSHLGWIEPRPPGDFVLRTVPWRSGSTSGRVSPAADGVRIDLEVPQGPTPTQLEADSWIANADGTTLWLRGSRDGRPTTLWLPIERGVDGVPSSHGRLTDPGGGGGVVDVAHVAAGLVTLRHDPSAGYSLTLTAEGDQTVWGLPDGFAPTAPGSTSITTIDDAVLLTDGSRRWRVDAERAVRSSASVVHAAPLSP